MLTIAQQDIIRFLLKPFVEQIVEAYPQNPDYARVALIIAMSGKSNNLLQSYMNKITDNANVIQATQFVGRLFNGEHNLRPELTKCGDSTPTDDDIQQFAGQILPRLFFNAYKKSESYKNDSQIRMRVLVVAYFLSNENGNWYGNKASLRDETTNLIHALKKELSIGNTKLEGYEPYSPANLSNFDLSNMQLPSAQIKSLNLRKCNLRGTNLFGGRLDHLEMNDAATDSRSNMHIITYEQRSIPELMDIIATIPHDRTLKKEKPAPVVYVSVRHDGVFAQREPAVQELQRQVAALQEENKRLKEQLKQDAKKENPNCSIS